MTTTNPTKALKALLVEDNPIIQKAQRWLLEELGFQVDLAGSGEAALQLFEAMRGEGCRYEIAIMDFGLPDMDGSDVIKVLKKHHSDTIVVVVTACVSDTVINTCREAGSDLVLKKPISAEELKKHLQNFIPSQGEKNVR
jgi:CheY-like chemotaxis protein